MPAVAIAGIIPNLFLGWLVYQVWHKPVKIIVPVIFVLGMCFDLTMPDMLGLQSLLMILMSIGIDEFHKPLEKDSFISMLITIGLVSIFYALFMFVVYGVQAGFGGKLLLSLLIMVFYNAVTAVLVCAVFVFLSRLKLDFRHG